MVKLEIGRAYATRGGERVKLFKNGECVEYPFYHDRGKTGGYHAVYRDGRSCVGEHGYDIISEWPDTHAEVIGSDAQSFNAETIPEALLDDLQAAYPQPRSKYHRIIKGVELDIYDILVAWGVTCPARQHAIKKLLMAGERGAKGVVQDLDEAIQAVERAKDLVG